MQIDKLLSRNVTTAIHFIIGQKENQYFVVVWSVGSAVTLPGFES